MEIHPIRTPEDHAAAVAEVERLWGAREGTPEGDRLEVLAILIDAYESAHFPMAELDPIETIKAHMDMAGHSQAELAALIGSRSRASEIMNRKRALNLQQVQKIVEAWHIPAELLIQPYRLAA
ncbi:helix-turn-helix domain-containing protein [Beijerinckia mobilis]|uniref:helix-turn-helix domain-containing protein n=1 Tax=Beijerinckia mobilis TaxID=231434 RepID=UPI0005532AE4|nr:helix-turn-helix domain-containing protein [Beijerinckia mobilis]